MEKIVIAIDTMGTDNGSAYFVQGIAEAMDLYDDLSFIVTGKEEELKTYIDQYGCDKTRIEVVDATEEIPVMMRRWMLSVERRIHLWYWR